MKKRLFTLFLAICMVCTLLPFSAFAASATSGKCGDNATWTFKDGVLTISGNGIIDTNSYIDGSPPWQSLIEDITTVKINNGITSIALSAFFGCKNMTNITIPDSVTSIGAWAFYGCSSLTDLIIPESVTSIGYNAFWGCSSLSNVTIPSGIDSINDLTFCECALTSVVIPNGVTRIGSHAFGDCKNLTSVVIPDSVTDISGGAFGGCSKLKNIEIPDSVTYIGSEAFSGCKSLTELTIPKNADLGDLVFSECSNLESISIPESVTSIGEGTFYNCNNLTDVYYGGTKAQWNELLKHTGNGNEPLFNVTVHYKEYPSNNSTKQTNPFKDVAKDSYCYDAVLWAVDKGITNGVDKTHFAPGNDCTRGQIVTFLWRANGSPSVKGMKNPFVDVEKGSYCYEAVLWAVKEGITKGFDATHFKPGESCTRGQVVTFLWRAEGKPAPASTKCPFKDVEKGAFYYDAMLWAVGEGITNGTDATHFAPNQTCTRGQIVTFLYRDMA